MKPTFLTAAAISALIAVPALAQQGGGAFEPGANFLAAWDTDGDGSVTLDEIKARRSDLFAGFDADEDGTLNAAELALMDEARAGAMQRPAGAGHGGGMARQAMGHAAMDADRDGTVSLDEFLVGAEQWLAMMDGTGDGVLTVADFGPGARRGGGQMMGQGMRQGRGPGMAPGQPGGGFAQGQGFDPSRGPGWMQGQPWAGFPQGQGMPQGQGFGQQGRGNGMQGHGGQGGQHGKGGQAGRGGHGGQGMGHGKSAAVFEGFPTPDGGLWVVDGRTGDILLCRAVDDSTAAAGFKPVCAEAELLADPAE